MISLLLTILGLAAVCAAAQRLAVRVLRLTAVPGAPETPQRLYANALFARRSAFCAAFALLAQMCVQGSFTAALSGWPAVLVAVCAAVLYWLCALARAWAQGKAPRAQAAVVLPVLLVCALCAEVFLYGAKAFSTAAYTGTPPDTVFTDGVTGSDARLTELRYENIGADVKNIRLAVGAVASQRKLDSLTQAVTFSPEELSGHPVTVRIFATDAANARELALTERTVLYDVPGTQILTLHLAPPVQSLRVELDAPSYYSAVVLAQELNARVPLRVSPVRVLVLFLLASLAWLLRPRSFVWALVLNKASKRQRLCFLGAAAACVLALWGAALLNRGFYVNPQPQDAQYQELARSLAAGEVSIGDAPAYLAQMENPYDTALRGELAAVYAPEDRVGYRFDVAYFAGKYYVYFGIVPAVLFYLPFYLLTGRDMPNIFATLALLPFYVGGVWLLLRRLATRFARLPAALYACVCTAVSLCSSAVFLAKRPDFYALPILTALVCTVWGLLFWWTATEKPDKRGVPHSGFLFAGSLCMALVAGCRPQMILFSALAVPIFWHSVLHARTLFSKKGLGATACAAAPYVLVAAGLMYYNFIRFGSPLEFGAQYNLTVADMTQRGFVFGRTAQGLFQYLFQPPVLSAVFPFVLPADSTSLYLGYVFNDPPFGGMLVCNPFLWALALLPACRAALQERRLWGVSLTALGAALAVVVVNIQMGGVLQRYFSDFGVMLFFVAALAVFAAFAKLATAEAGAQHTDAQSADAQHTAMAHHTPLAPQAPRTVVRLRAALLCVTAASLAYSAANVFMGTLQALATMDISRFYAALHAVCFWV